MNSKMMKDCFAPHVVMHSLFGLGLGLLLSTIIPSLSNFWLAIVLMVVAVVWDAKRKS